MAEERERQNRIKKGGKMSIFRVAAVTNTNDLGLAIAQRVQEKNIPFLHCIGAGAVNQANKAVATANNILEQNGKQISIKPEFIDLETEEYEELRKGIRMELIVGTE